MYQIGMSTTNKITEERFQMYQRAGVKIVELSIEAEAYKTLDYDILNEWCEKYGVRVLSYHLPFFPFDALDISKRSLADYSVKYLSSLIEEATSNGIYRFIIHPSGEPIEESERAERLACAKESLFKLQELSSSKGATICVENLPRTCLGRSSDDILELLSAHKDLRACFDTNHLLSEDPIEFIRKVGDKIVTTHISDYDFINERHWLPGEGKLDWQAILNALKNIGYSGPWMYEINLELPSTIIRPRELVAEDFVKNANEIFEGKPLTVISTPKPNLGVWG
ncbi:MAG: sugar phosphate isomerase/epimerase [Clostridia bacterium]|nr:sugar phosphate isomerase/epimerase [Clostridia bacterium]